jgi:peptidyl-prolyl cis-trans isomerase C
MERRHLRSSPVHLMFLATLGMAWCGWAKAQTAQTPTAARNAGVEQANGAKTIVAEVDGRAITLGDVADAIADLPPSIRALPFERLFPDVLSQLVNQQALVIRAQRQGLDEDPTVRRKMKAVSDRVLGDALLLRETADSVTEAALLERYRRDIEGKPGPDEVHVGVIMVPTEGEAQALIGALRDGGDFAALARRSSKDPSALSGGDAGFVTREQLTPEVAGAVFSLAPGRCTEFPVHGAAGWFVLRVVERRQQATRSFGAVKEELRRTMIRERGPEAVKSTLGEISVRIYDINGQELDNVPHDSASPGPGDQRQENSGSSLN